VPVLRKLRYKMTEEAVMFREPLHLIYFARLENMRMIGLKNAI